ncbi:MAG: hypothetical protein M1828_004125 [Chrysothrix sp. TS-e1954]|nr:MAG: hypothetical protein M1828_004125 [Chrysothrix sp. TS-e1954]
MSNDSEESEEGSIEEQCELYQALFKHLTRTRYQPSFTFLSRQNAGPRTVQVSEALGNGFQFVQQMREIYRRRRSLENQMHQNALVSRSNQTGIEDSETEVLNEGNQAENVPEEDTDLPSSIDETEIRSPDHVERTSVGEEAEEPRLQDSDGVWYYHVSVGAKLSFVKKRKVFFDVCDYLRPGECRQWLGISEPPAKWHRLNKQLEHDYICFKRDGLIDVSGLESLENVVGVDHARCCHSLSDISRDPKMDLETNAFLERRRLA